MCVSSRGSTAVAVTDPSHTQACAPQLRDKLGEPVPSNTVLVSE